MDANHPQSGVLIPCNFTVNYAIATTEGAAHGREAHIEVTNQLIAAAANWAIAYEPKIADRVGFLASIIGAVLNAFFQAVAAVWKNERDRADIDDAHERAGAAEVANETQQTISEIADARSRLPPHSDDPDALARRLRSRKAAAGYGDPGGSGKDESGRA